MVERMEFLFGRDALQLAVPPFFVDFEKGRFRSIMVRKKVLSAKRGTLFHIYVTQSHQVPKLALGLKSIHPDLYIPERLLASASTKGTALDKELAAFRDAVLELEKAWSYEGNGVWGRRFDSVTVHMILLLKEDRWTIRPAVSKYGLEGFGVEIPVDARLAEQFVKDLKEDELEMMHDHTITLHFHLTVMTLERYIELAKKWDYYFSELAIWPPALDIRFIE